MANEDLKGAEAIRAEARKTKDTAEKMMAKGDAPRQADDVRRLARMVRQLAEQVEQLAARRLSLRASAGFRSSFGCCT